MALVPMRLWSGTWDRATLWPVLLWLILASGCAHYPQSNRLLQSPPEDMPQHVELTEVPFFPQTDYHCGPAALATMLTFQGKETDPDTLAPLVYVPEKHGSFQVEMVAAARSFGLPVYPLQPEMSDILREVAARSPVLVLQNLGLSWLPVWHFAVVVGYDLQQGKIWLRSGTNPREDMYLGTFERSWRNAGYWSVVINSPTQIPVTARPLAYVKSLEDLHQTDQTLVAMEGYRSAMIRWPQAPVVLLGAGNLAYRQQQFSLAVDAFSQLVQQHPGLPEGWNNLAYALAQSGCGNAAEAAQCALLLAPKSADTSAFRSTAEDIRELLATDPKPASSGFSCPDLPDCISSTLP